LFRAVVQNHRQTVDAELDRDVAIHRVTTADPRAIQTQHQPCIRCYPPQGGSPLEQEWRDGSQTSGSPTREHLVLLFGSSCPSCLRNRSAIDDLRWSSREGVHAVSMWSALVCIWSADGSGSATESVA
jgi:hypothetical protein